MIISKNIHNRFIVLNKEYILTRLYLDFRVSVIASVSNSCWRISLKLDTMDKTAGEEYKLQLEMKYCLVYSGKRV